MYRLIMSELLYALSTVNTLFIAGFCEVAEPLRMFCIVCRRQTKSPPSVSQLTSPTVSRCASSSPGTPVGPAVSILRPASLDFKVRHRSKIVVSSPGDSSRHLHPRHIPKRSLSFSYSPAKHGRKSLQRTKRTLRSASISGNVAFQGDITMLSDFSNNNIMSTSKEESFNNHSCMPEVDSKGNEANVVEGLPSCSNFTTCSAKSLKGRTCNNLDVEHLESSSELPAVSCVSFDTAKSSKPELPAPDLSLLRTLKRSCNISTNTQNNNLESVHQSNGSTERQSSKKLWNVEYRLQNDSFARQSQEQSKTETLKYEDVFTSDLQVDSEYKRPHTPTSANFYPFWPESPLVLFSDRERIPFLSDTPVKTLQAEDIIEAISEIPKEDLSVNLPKPSVESFGAAFVVQTGRENADSTSMNSVGRPFITYEGECHTKSNFCLENWNLNSSFLNDKANLHRSREAESREGFLKPQKTMHIETAGFGIIEASPELVNLEGENDLKKRETRVEIPHPHDDNQVNQPMEVNLICPSNEEPMEKSFKETKSTDIFKVHNVLHTIDAEVLESPQLSSYHASPRQPEYVKNAANDNSPSIESLKLHDTVKKFVPKAFSSSLNPTAGADCISKLIVTPTSERPSSIIIGPRSPCKNVTGNENTNTTEERSCVFTADLGQLCTRVASENGTRQVSTEVLTKVVDNFYGFDTNQLAARGKDICLEGENCFESGNPGRSGIIREERLEEVVAKIPKENPVKKLSSRKRPYLHLPQQHSENISKNLALNPDTRVKSCKLSAIQVKQQQNSFTDTPNYPEFYDLSVVIERGGEYSSVSPSKSSVLTSTGKGHEAPINDVGVVMLKGTSCSRGECDVQPSKMDEKSDCKPLAVSCVAEEKVEDFHEDTGAHQGSVIETSLVHDWGLQRASKGRSSKLKKDSYSLHFEENRSVEVRDVHSELDKPHGHTDIWSVIENEFPEPVTVICSPPSSVNTFTLRFPGKVASEGDVAEEFADEIITTKEETLLLEKRLQGVFAEPVVVNYSHDNSGLVGSLGARCPNKTASSKRNLTLSVSGNVEAFEQVVSVASVPQKSNEKLQTSKLPESYGFVPEGSELFVDSSPRQPRFTETEEYTMLWRSNKWSETAASQILKSSKKGVAIQSKKSGVHENQVSRRQPDNESSARENCPFKDHHTKSTCLMKAVDNSSLQTAGDCWNEAKVTTATEAQPSRKRRQEAQGGREIETKIRQRKLVCLAQLKGKEEGTEAAIERVKIFQLPSELPCSNRGQENEEQTPTCGDRVKTENCLDKLKCSARPQGYDTRQKNDVASLRTVNCMSNLYCTRERHRKEKQTQDSMERLPLKHAHNSRTHATNAEEKVDLIRSGKACVTLKRKARMEAKNTAQEEKKKFVTFAPTPIKKSQGKDLIKERREQRSSLTCSSGHPDVKADRHPENVEDKLRPSMNESPKAKEVLGQEPVAPSGIQSEAYPKNPIASDLKNSPLRDDKHFTATLDAVKTSGFDSPTEGRSSSQTVRSGEKSASDPAGTKEIGFKWADRNAFTARHLKQDKITNPKKSMNATISQQDFSKKLEKNVQVDINKDRRSEKSRDREPLGGIKPLGDIDDVEKDTHACNRTISGERKNEQLKSSSTPLLSNTGRRRNFEPKAPNNVFVPIFSDDKRLIGHYTESSHRDHNQGLDTNDTVLSPNNQAYAYPRWVAPIRPGHSSLQHNETKGLPQFIPNASNRYSQRGITNRTRFQLAYPRFPNYGRPVFVRGMWQARPVLTLPGPWSSPGNTYRVPNTPIRPR